MGENPQQLQISSDPVKARYDKLNILRDMGRDPFEETVSNRDITCAEIAQRFDELEEKNVCVAGRIMSKRGKLFPLQELLFQALLQVLLFLLHLIP